MATAAVFGGAGGGLARGGERWRRGGVLKGVGGASDLGRGHPRAVAAALTRTPAGVRLGHARARRRGQMGRLGLRPSSVRGERFKKNIPPKLE